MDPTLASQMHIDIRSMRYFIALAREGSMSKAAVSLRVTQPTLSRQIGLLEQGSGKQLYERRAGRIRLTQEGRLLLEYAEKMVELADRAAQELSGGAAAITGHVAIACAESCALEVLGRCIARLHEHHPDIIVDLHTGSPLESFERLDAGIMDFLVDVDGAARSGYEKLFLPSSGNVWVATMRADDPLAVAPKITPADLAGKSVFTSRLSMKSGQIQNWAGDYFDEMRLNTTYNLGTYLIAAMAANGVGYALTYKGLQDIVGDPRVVSVPLDPPMVDQSVLIWKRRRSMSRACVVFLETLRSLLAEEDDQGI